MKYSLSSSRKAFSIIELMVGIFIFTLWLLSVYMVLMTSINANERNKNAIIASNLAREQIEIFRNIRDTNYKKLQVWNQQNPQENFTAWVTKLFSTGSYYTLENDFSNPSAYVNISEISSFVEGETELANMQNYRLCFDWEKNYRSCWNVTPTHWIELPFYRYLLIEELTENGVVVPNAFLITSKVIWSIKGYHEFEIKTILNDWRRI